MSTELEAPLEGLLAKPLHLMSEEELRAQAQRLRELRESTQTLMAAFRRGTTKEPKASVFDEF